MRMNLSEAVKTWAQRFGDEIAIGGDESLSYSQLNLLADVVASQICSWQSEGEKKIAILTYSNVKFVIYLLGIIRSGNVYVLINPTLSVSQLEISLQKIKCDYYITDEKTDNIHNSERIEISLEINKYDRKNENMSCRFLGVNDHAGVIFSSGTTGLPKALVRSNYSILTEAIQWIIELQLHIGSRFLIPRPLYYTGGFVLMYATLFAGGRVDLLSDISTESILNYLMDNSEDWSFIVPSLIREMNQCKKPFHISGSVLTMGSPILYEDKIRFHEKYQCNVIEVWGNSEGIGTITIPSDLYDKPYSVGRPFFTDFVDVAESELLNKKNGKKCGVLFGASDNEFTEYIGEKNLTQEVLHDGFIYSEDIGVKDADGYFYLTGRVDDIIVVNGMRIFPNDIEKVLMNNNSIIDCAVLAVKDNKGNDLVAAAIVTDGHSDIRNIIQDVNEKLKVHERIGRYLKLDYIPRNHGGKIEKNVIVALMSMHT